MLHRLLTLTVRRPDWLSVSLPVSLPRYHLQNIKCDDNRTDVQSHWKSNMKKISKWKDTCPRFHKWWTIDKQDINSVPSLQGLELPSNGGGHLPCAAPIQWLRENIGTKQLQLETGNEIVEVLNYGQNSEGGFSAINTSLRYTNFSMFCR